MRVAAAYVRAVLRRRDWGRDEVALARRARRLFGVPPALSRPFTRGLRVETVEARTAHGVVRGEWLVPRDARAGVLLYVHGGGFVSCSPRTHRPLTAALARRTRRRVFAVDYRRAPESRFPAALDDVVVAYRWLHETQAARRVAVAGDSAGGGLALSLAVRVRDERSSGERSRDAALPAPACVVGFSPWTDLAGAGASARENDRRDAMFRTPNIADFAGAYLGPAGSAADPLASPVYAPLHDLPPLLLHVGSTELLLDDARRVHDAVTRAGGACELRVYDDAFHGWQMLVGFLPEATGSVDAAAAFVARHLDGASR
jgi:acetyl esterase/lipase